MPDDDDDRLIIAINYAIISCLSVDSFSIWTVIFTCRFAVLSTTINEVTVR